MHRQVGGDMRRPPVVDVGRDEARTVKHGADAFWGRHRQIDAEGHCGGGHNRGGEVVGEVEDECQADDPANDAPEKIGGSMTVGVVHRGTSFLFAQRAGHLDSRET
jgi:hypothetical protein